jgi:hypothetical protein
MTTTLETDILKMTEDGRDSILVNESDPIDAVYRLFPDCLYSVYRQSAYHPEHRCSGPFAIVRTPNGEITIVSRKS